jgi:riboflavin-specific deaminase-like protein
LICAGKNILTPMSLRIIANLALTADGKISTSGKSPARFTSKRDLERLKEIRLSADAILVGRGTLEEDQMSLSADKSPSPWRCVISETGRFDPRHPLFHTEGGPIHLIVTGTNQPEIPGTIIHHSSLAEFIEWLSGQASIETLLCEGGGQLMAELFRLDLVDELHLTLACHTLFGGTTAPSLTGLPGEFLSSSRHFELSKIEKSGSDEFFLHYLRSRP